MQDLTLSSLFQSDPQMYQLFRKSFGFVSVDATLGDAKLVMEKIDKCGDVFVTQSGKLSEPLLGWVTDSTIIENSKL
jgi:hypothetical protein